MDAGFFRVSRSAGIRGEVRGLSVRLGRRPKLGPVWPTRGGFGDPDGPPCRGTLPPHACPAAETSAPLRSLLLRDRPPYAAATVAGKWRREGAGALPRRSPA